MKTISFFISKHLYFLHKGTIVAKLKSSVYLSVAVSPFVLLLERLKSEFISSNIDFIAIVFIAIAIDHSLGTIVHLKNRDFSIKKNMIGLFTKLGITIAGVIIFGMISFILKEDKFIKHYFNLVTHLTIFLYPGYSALKNMSFLTNSKFPPIGWFKKIDKFQENLDISEFKKKYNENY